MHSEVELTTGPEVPLSGYRIVRLASWPKARGFGTAFPRHPQIPGGDQFWCFRGQADACWGLETTLEREVKRRGLPPQARAEREWLMVHEFGRRVHLHGDHHPADANAIESLALIQHYGGSTRLLDFTYSFYVACFFAMDEATTDAAVWVISLGALRRAVAKREGSEGWDGLLAFSNWWLLRSLEALERPIVDNGVAMVEPHAMSERLAAQQGLFLFPLNVAASFEDNLTAALDLPAGCLREGKTSDYGDDGSFGMEAFVPAVQKIVLPKQIHAAALKDLRQMNITAASLFPGLDGFARSLRWYLRP